MNISKINAFSPSFGLITDDAKERAKDEERYRIDGWYEGPLLNRKRIRTKGLYDKLIRKLEKKVPDFIVDTSKYQDQAIQLIYAVYDAEKYKKAEEDKSLRDLAPKFFSRDFVSVSTRAFEYQKDKKRSNKVAKRKY